MRKTIFDYEALKKADIDYVILKVIETEDKINIASKIMNFDQDIYADLQEINELYSNELEERIRTDKVDEDTVNEKYDIIEKRYYQGKK